MDSSAGHVPGLPGTGTEQEHEHVLDLVFEHDLASWIGFLTLTAIKN